MKKKNLIMSLAVVATMGMVLTGCGNKSENVTVDDQTATQTAVTDPVNKPLIDEDPVAPAEEATTETETVTETVESTEGITGEDFLTANNIEITPTGTDYIIADGIVAEDLGLTSFFTSQAFEVSETETIIKVYNVLNIRGNDCYNFSVLADFYDRSTGESILKKSDIYSMHDTEAKTLETQDGFTVSAAWSTDIVTLDEFTSFDCSVITYTISHPANCEIVLQLGSYDSEVVRTENEALSSDKHTLLDRPSLLDWRSKIFTATDH